MADKSLLVPVTEWLNRLQDHAYRITAPRQAVVEVMASSQRPLGPLEVFELARQRYPKLGLVTIYRTLEKLEELALIQRVHQPSGCHAFVASYEGHQHLLICNSCGRTSFFEGDGDGIQALMAAVADQSGYQIQDHWLQLFGVCRSCQDSIMAGRVSKKD